MNTFKRGVIFITFLGSCVAIVFLVAGLGSKHWVNARAKRTTNPQESDGRIQFGLFQGKKELNVAYGWRTYEIDVIQLLRDEPEFLKYGFWLGTVLCLCLSIILSCLAGLFSAINAATTTSSFLADLRGLYLWNTLALLFECATIGLWIAQFFLSIQYNVVAREDRENKWTSEGMAELGYSFWFIVGAVIANSVNIVIIYIANTERREATPIYPVIEEKTNGAIMLY